MEAGGPRAREMGSSKATGWELRTPSLSGLTPTTAVHGCPLARHISGAAPARAQCVQLRGIAGGRQACVRWDGRRAQWEMKQGARLLRPVTALPTH